MKRKKSVPARGALLRLMSILILALLVPATLAAADMPVKRVLVLYPYSPEYPAWNHFLAGLKEGFAAEKEYRLELYYEFFDGERFSANPGHLQETAEYFKSKYRSNAPDIVVASSFPGESVAVFASVAFPGIPVLFATNETSGEVPGNPANVYALRGPYEFAKTFDFIHLIDPRVSRVLIVIGTSERERIAVAELRRLARFWEGLLEFEFLDSLTYPEILDRVATAPPNAAVAFFWLFRDAAGTAFVPADVARALSERSAVPVFGIQRSYLGTGIAGGYLWDTGTFGKNAAIAALEILRHGERVTLRDRKIDASATTVDWAALGRWKLDTTRLSADTVVVNRPRSNLDWYGAYVFVAVILVASNLVSLGILFFYRDSKRKTERELDVVNVRLSLSLKEGAELNRRLDSRALRDPLTGLFNRKHVNERIGDEFLRYERTRSEFSIIQVDVDSFQTVNQRFGSETGNILLSRIAAELTKLVRLYDVLGRWSGEEFMVLLPDTDEQSATGFAERIRKAVSGAVYFEHEHKLVVTISCGVASSSLVPTVAELTRNAGLALAEAQRRGRNRVMPYSSLAEKS